MGSAAPGVGEDRNYNYNYREPERKRLRRADAPGSARISTGETERPATGRCRVVPTLRGSEDRNILIHGTTSRVTVRVALTLRVGQDRNVDWEVHIGPSAELVALAPPARISTGGLAWPASQAHLWRWLSGVSEDRNPTGRREVRSLVDEVAPTLWGRRGATPTGPMPLLAVRGPAWRRLPGAGKDRNYARRYCRPVAPTL